MTVPHTEKVTRRQGSLIKLRPECEEQYIILHKHTFPGVLERIKKSHIRNYSIFLYAGYLFSYFEYTGDAYDDDMNAIADPTTKEWWKLTDPMQDPLPTRQAGEWWAEMELLLHPDETMEYRPGVHRHGYTAQLKPGSVEAVRNLLQGKSRFIFRSLDNLYIQNFNLYFKDDMLYIYFEYTGSDFPRDRERLQNDADVVRWNGEFERYLQDPWQEMREVFHTDSLMRL
jgi:L-rhamnose mutarotase